MEQGHPMFDIGNIRDHSDYSFQAQIQDHHNVFGDMYWCNHLCVSDSQEPMKQNQFYLLKFGREFMSRPEVGTGGLGLSIPPETIIAGEISILTSRDLIDKGN